MNLCCFKAEGVNLERQLDLLIKKGVPVSNVRRPSAQVMLFEAPSACRRKVVDFFKERCYNITVEKTKGLAGFMFFFRSRLTLLVALIVTAASLFVLGGYVWRVEFECDNNVDLALLQTALTENNIRAGVPVKSIDYKAAQNIIFNALPSVKYAGVSIRGCTLFVAVVAEETPEPIFDFKTPRDIVAEFDGVVTRVVVVSGTALVKKGDTIVKGQVLIQGKRTFPDETQEDVCAVGEVFAQASYTGEEQFYTYVNVFKKTGRKQKIFTFSLFKYTPKGKNEIVFANQVIEETYQTLFPLPVKIITRTVYETVEVRAEQNFELLKSEYEQKALAKALAVFRDGNITQTEFTYEQNKHGFLVKARVYSEKKVSVYA